MLILEHMLVQIAPVNFVEDEHVADNMDGGGVQIAARMVELEDGDSSSDAGFQAADEGDDEGLTNRRLDGDLEHGAASGPCSARLILN
jgi:hypothetical protein